MHNRNFTLDDISVIPKRNTVINGEGVTIKLQPKVIRVLVVLAEKYPEPVSREFLIDDVWEGNYYVGTKALTNAIWQLRKSLAGGVSSEEFPQNDNDIIETVRKVGYRLNIAPQLCKSASTKASRLFIKPYFYKYIVALIIAEILGFIYYSMNFKQGDDLEGNHLKIKQNPHSEKMNTPFISLSPSGKYAVYKDRSGFYISNSNGVTMDKKWLSNSVVDEVGVRWSEDDQWLFFISRDENNKACFIYKLHWRMEKSNIVDHCSIEHDAIESIAVLGDRLIYRVVSEEKDVIKLYDLRSNKFKKAYNLLN